MKTATNQMNGTGRRPSVHGVILVLLCTVLLSAGTTVENAAVDRAFARADIPVLEQFRARYAAGPTTNERGFGAFIGAAIAYRQTRLGDCTRILDSLTALPHVWPAELSSRIHKLKCVVNTDLQFYDHAVVEADIALSHIDSTTNPGLFAEVLVVKAEALSEIPDHAQAWKLLAQAYDLADQAHNGRAKGMALLGMGNIHFRQGDYDQAFQKYKTAITAVNDPLDLIAVRASSNLAAAAVMNKDYDTALNLMDSLLRTLGTKDPLTRSRCLATMGYVNMMRKDYGPAINLLNSALVLIDSAALGNERAKPVQHLSRALWKSGDRDRALTFALDALDRANTTNDRILQRELHHRLSSWYMELERPKEALEHQRAYARLSDSLAVATYDKRLAHAQVLFDTERKEHRIAEQQQELALAAAEDRRKNIQRIALAAAVLGITVIALLLWRALRNRRVLAEQQRVLHTNEVDELMHRNEINAINAMLDGQEKERDRVAKDLHDRLGAMLSTIKMQVTVLEDKVELVRDDQRDQYGKVNRLLDEAVGEVRRISYDMVTVTLSRFGLATALESLCDAVRVTGKLEVEQQLHGLEQRMERSVEIVVYRIVQELISNVLKHANAKEISVSVTRETGRLSVMVSDDGRGFDTENARRGMGLENVQSRARSIGATVRIDSRPGHGTTVSVEGPLVE